MRNPFRSGLVRGLALIALVSLVIVALSLQSSLATANALVGVAFFLAIAFFLFLVWRERRAEIETWSDLSQRTFYGAIVLAVVDIAAFIALSPDGPESVAFLLVLAACVYAVVRVWRREHTYA